MSKVICPRCATQFEITPLEEVLNPTVSITRNQIGRSSWQDIAELVRGGYSYRLFDIGDTVSFKLKDGTDFAMDVAGFNIYGDNTVVLVAHDCLPNEHFMNRQNTYGDSGGWKNCDMRKCLNQDLLSLFPDDLVEVIKPRQIIQKIDGTEYDSIDKLWLPSQTEMFKNSACDIDVGDKHLPLFSGERSRVKERNGETWYWWLRTPCAGYGNYVRLVPPTGTLSNYTAYNSYGVAPACVIG